MRAGSETEKAQPGAAKETDRDAALTDAGACSDGSRARCRPCSWSPCRRLRPLPLQKAGRLRVRAFNYPVVNVRDLVALHLPNAPSDDPLYPGLLGRGISQLIPKRRDVAGRIDLEDSGDPLGGHPALELLLDCGLADARGRRTQGARRDHVDDSIIGVQGERRSRIPAGDGVHMFTLDPSIGAYLLAQENIRMPKAGRIYSTNEAYQGSFPEPIQRYLKWVKDAGNYTSRYIGSLVADFHRTLIRGGVFLYPGSTKSPQGKLRLLYEANPLAFVAEQADGMATDGQQRILEKRPQAMHERTPLIIGSKDEVQRVLSFY